MQPQRQHSLAGITSAVAPAQHAVKELRQGSQIVLHLAARLGLFLIAARYRGSPQIQDHNPIFVALSVAGSDKYGTRVQLPMDLVVAMYGFEGGGNLTAQMQRTWQR